MIQKALRGSGRTAVVLAATAVALGTLALIGTRAAGAAPARIVAVLVDATTTTTTPTPPTTTVPASTTTPPTTTPTSVPTTTSTRAPRPTTTIGPTSTTNPGQAAASSKTPWALIIVIIVLVIAIGLVALLMRSRTKRGIEAEWRRSIAPAVTAAQLARESLLSGSPDSDDQELRSAVAVQVERAAIALERSTRTAPDPQAGAMATSAAGALRGLAFAIEADRLLRHGSAAPSGVQLAQADQARRDSSAELTTALARLSTRVGARAGSKAAR